MVESRAIRRGAIACIDKETGMYIVSYANASCDLEREVQRRKAQLDPVPLTPRTIDSAMAQVKAIMGMGG